MKRGNKNINASEIVRECNELLVKFENKRSEQIPRKINLHKGTQKLKNPKSSKSLL